MRIGCVLLAAGSGKRFGGNKLCHTVEGLSLAERACKLHTEAMYTSRVLVGRPADSFIAKLAAKYGFTLAVNERAAQGIGTSAAKGTAALLALDPSVDGVLYAVSDQPYLSQDTVTALMLAFASAPGAIVAPFCNGERGNPVIFPKALLPEFATLTGDIGGGAILRAHASLLVPVPRTNAIEFFDMDTKP